MSVILGLFPFSAANYVRPGPRQSFFDHKNILIDGSISLCCIMSRGLSTYFRCCWWLRQRPEARNFVAYLRCLRLRVYVKIQWIGSVGWPTTAQMYLICCNRCADPHRAFNQSFSLESLLLVLIINVCPQLVSLAAYLILVHLRRCFNWRNSKCHKQDLL